MERTRLAVLVLALCACPSPPPAEQHPADETLSTVDRIIRGGAAPRDPQALAACIARIDREGLCVPKPAEPRTFKILCALDPRYASKWPAWEERLASTMRCVNRLYADTGVQWDIADVEEWDPGSERHALYPLLDRLQREHPANGRRFRLGITVWDERRVYSKGAGEIGLSQGTACVVPSWPRAENDCLILAHELGHLVRARHVPGERWIMGWKAQPFYLPAADPLARVVATYRFHPLNVALIGVHRTAALTRAGLLPTPPCAERLQRIRRCWRGR